eukprot:CAMPEP_0172902370 /NCGR_PEP_ID=MMETSP1075-20121228/168266_1 /TAXON_ID=2916 /ORGANISM="Ceratium fusus, Strain PA161109" /LENGTH=52 /DNA_ID=CAMNT_0013758947 /DNA_START=74 /DNA_END=228 /DNA_ORIENTATION=+
MAIGLASRKLKVLVKWRAIYRGMATTPVVFPNQKLLTSVPTGVVAGWLMLVT